MFSINTSELIRYFDCIKSNHKGWIVVSKCELDRVYENYIRLKYRDCNGFFRDQGDRCTNLYVFNGFGRANIPDILLANE